MDGLTSTFPPPPFYYKSFTDENIAAVAELGPSEKQALEKPLNHLVPPPAPDAATYRGFGTVWNTQEKLIPLEEAGVAKLYGDLGDDYQGLVTELKKLLRSALVNFVALVGTMATDPQAFPGKIDDLRTIFINMHHLLNLYRPHQSRESVVFLMQDQLAQIRADIDATRASNEEIAEKIRELTEKLPDLGAAVADTQPESSEWQGLDLSVDQAPVRAQVSRASHGEMSRLNGISESAVEDVMEE